jgi:hydrogenase nickel incorporation protein HypA/HybF
MHEVSLVTALVAQVDELARVEGFDRVLLIRLRVGALSGAAPEAISFCFSEVTRHTVLFGAQLILDWVEIELDCRACGATTSPTDSSALLCGQCDSAEVHVRAGREFGIADLEVQ